jgi:hypothetical protein
MKTFTYHQGRRTAKLHEDGSVTLRWNGAGAFLRSEQRTYESLAAAQATKYVTCGHVFLDEFAGLVQTAQAAGA